MTAGPLPLSAVLITKNAADSLAACLRSLDFCDEVVVVDSGSEDGTPELARSHGARVMESEWRGFGLQKQFAVQQARNDWVLCIDADERVSKELRAAIVAALAGPVSSPPDVTAYRFPRCNRFLGRYLRHGEGYPDWSLRLFHRDHARWSEDAVHEKVLCEGPVADLTGDLLHDSAESLGSYLSKQNRYTTLAAAEARTKGKRASTARMLLSPLFRFLKFYLLRRGFLDGLPGLVHILIGCQNSFFKYAKMLEAERRESGR